jgi:HAD superfamily hydrolase (TIGR01493 family)
MRPIRGVMFDMGDTLLGRGDGPAILRDEARKLGRVVDDEAARRMWRAIQERAPTPEEIAKGRDLSERAHRECWTALYSAADVIADGLGEILYEREISADAWMPFPDTKPTLEALGDAAIPMVVVSDTGWDIRPVLAKHGLLDFFAGLVLSYEHGAAKPAPQLFATACEQLGVGAEDALMVGDNALTDGGAIESGVRVYLLPAQHTPGPRGLDAVLRLAGVTAP